MKPLIPIRLLALLGASPCGAQTMVPDFSVPDLNSTGYRRRATAAPVSPRDYLHQVSAWYFGWES